MMESGFWPVLTLRKHLKSLDVENGDVVIAAVAGKALPEVAGDGDAVHSVGVGDGADELVGGRVDDFGLRAVGDVQAMIGAVHVNVIPISGSADFNFADDFVCGRRGV